MLQNDGSPGLDIRVYSQLQSGLAWLAQCQGQRAQFACVLGFTETGVLPGISAAGATPADREFTAIADAEFLVQGVQLNPQFPLPPLVAGASPALISRAVVAGLNLPLTLFNAGLRHAPTVPCIDLGGEVACCVSTGRSLSRHTVAHLFQQGLYWGETLARQFPQHVLVLGECVVGGTTTALGVLTGLGWEVQGKVNSSHPTCNHQQKWELVQQGLEKAGLLPNSEPFEVVAAMGDPMQPVVAGAAIAASHHAPVLLAGGTQMLAIYALMQALRPVYPWTSEQVVVGTTRWVAEDATGDTVGLADLLGAPLLATQLNFTGSSLEPLRAYERGFVKEGVGAGGCAIAAHLQGWDALTLMAQVEALLQARYCVEQATAMS
ncbi:nicotinate mononucleotide-dependent phosphoribosyltransferase CobT [Leptolyngbya sp. FACHB-16]|uniref:nicotinate mononucleotide-dependent phosphoribosyltransferase CobT n=1 Tax=unclassified Leptolyngbya TaxID=2650499 RepID=UPI001F555B9B|nr:TIGR00303 family protein [Leptolyngbya sp. FACHB-16]